MSDIKYILIKADYNDGDYVTSKHEITDEQIELIKPVIKVIKDNDGNYPIGDMSDSSNNAELFYGHIEGFDLFEELVPYGEYGIHTIESIEIITIVESLLN